MPELKHFRYWCYKVLPLVYDDSLSYYEVLCKVVDYINKLIDQDRIFGEEIEELRRELEIVKDWINNFDTAYAQEILEKYLATMIFVEISDAGYIIYNIPERWEDIEFRTTRYDIVIPNTGYGKLVLLY